MSYTAFSEQRSTQNETCRLGLYSKAFCRFGRTDHFAQTEHKAVRKGKRNYWLIDIDGFMKTIAPKVYPENATMPRLRCIQTAVTEYNKAHERQIDKHVVEKCMQSDKVFKYNHGNRWIINYDELEPIIDDFLDKKSV